MTDAHVTEKIDGDSLWPADLGKDSRYYDRLREMTPEEWREQYLCQPEPRGNPFKDVSCNKLAQCAEVAERALQNASGFLDTPIARRRADGDWLYQPVVDSIRAALAMLEATRSR